MRRHARRDGVRRRQHGEAARDARLCGEVASVGDGDGLSRRGESHRAGLSRSHERGV
jgi:hypothetical protein